MGGGWEGNIHVDNGPSMKQVHRGTESEHDPHGLWLRLAILIHAGNCAMVSLTLSVMSSTYLVLSDRTVLPRYHHMGVHCPLSISLYRSSCQFYLKSPLKGTRHGTEYVRYPDELKRKGLKPGPIEKIEAKLIHSAISPWQ